MSTLEIQSSVPENIVNNCLKIDDAVDAKVTDSDAEGVADEHSMPHEDYLDEEIAHTIATEIKEDSRNENCFEKHGVIENDESSRNVYKCNSDSVKDNGNESSAASEIVANLQTCIESTPTSEGDIYKLKNTDVDTEFSNGNNVDDKIDGELIYELKKRLDDAIEHCELISTECEIKEESKSDDIGLNKTPNNVNSQPENCNAEKNVVQNGICEEMVTENITVIDINTAEKGTLQKYGRGNGDGKTETNEFVYDLIKGDQPKPDIGVTEDITTVAAIKPIEDNSMSQNSLDDELKSGTTFGTSDLLNQGKSELICTNDTYSKNMETLLRVKNIDNNTNLDITTEAPKSSETNTVDSVLEINDALKQDEKEKSTADHDDHTSGQNIHDINECDNRYSEKYEEEISHGQDISSVEVDNSETIKELELMEMDNLISITEPHLAKEVSYTPNEASKLNENCVMEVEDSEVNIENAGLGNTNNGENTENESLKASHLNNQHNKEPCTVQKDKVDSCPIGISQKTETDVSMTNDEIKYGYISNENSQKEEGEISEHFLMQPSKIEINAADTSANVTDIKNTENCITKGNFGDEQNKDESRKDKEDVCLIDVPEIEDHIKNKDINEECFDITDNCNSENELTDITESSARSKKESSLINDLDILSDDDDCQETTVTNTEKDKPVEDAKASILLEDNDDVLVIDEDGANNVINSKDCMSNENIPEKIPELVQDAPDRNEDIDMKIDISNDDTAHESAKNKDLQIIKQDKEDLTESKPELTLDTKPLVAMNFMKSLKTKMGDMTREDLEEFCLVKIVEGVVDRSNLSEIKGQIKTLIQSIDEWKKKAMVLNKQNRDLQIILKNVQDEQSKRSGEVITPLRITRSVGMQVLMTDSKAAQTILPTLGRPRKNVNTPTNTATKTPAKVPMTVLPKVKTPIPVPRLVPAANNSPSKPVRPAIQIAASPVANSIRANFQSKVAEKRPIGSVSIDLTDDEPPPKQMTTTKSFPTPPVRLIPAQQLMNRSPGTSNPRQVYIPINGAQGSNIRPGQSISFASNMRPRICSPRASSPRGPRPVQVKHPAPLPHAGRQLKRTGWKALPPAPDLKISKVENGIVISWKMEGYKESLCEEIVSYQLFAYQETSATPNTLLWKKIGDVKALPLPMACTLTQFMAGYKYYFAVRAVDAKSRMGPFSLPGSILLLNK